MSATAVAVGTPSRARGRWRRRLFAGALVLFAAGAAMHEHVVRSAAPFLMAAIEAPQADLIVVPGAKIEPGGLPCDLLVDRLEEALELYRLGKAPRVLVSGRGGGGLDTDEVAAMRRYLQDRGVPAAAILDDNEGLRTLDTMQRSVDVFGAHSVIVVSNPFHVARSVFLGREYGVTTIGVAAPYLRDYSRSTMWKNQAREVVARVRAWLDVFLLGTRSGS
jgi:SanA protein